MIAAPMNDHECLGPTTDQIVAELAAGNPAIVDLATQFTNTDDLAAWFRTLPQRDDEGDPADGPKVAACRPPQRLQLDNPSPNCFERSAVVSNAFRARASAGSKTRAHLGADLMYRRRDARDLIAVFPPGTPGGTPRFFMPEGIPALAASAGIVTFANTTPVGNTIIIRHANGWTTYYTHLATLAVRRGDSVIAGQTIGTIGASPEDAARIRHLHFELWKGAKRSGAVDPQPYLDAWSRVTSAWSPALVASAEPTPRNGTLSAYRRVGDRGEPYPDWVRALKGEAGVYVIRDADTHRGSVRRFVRGPPLRDNH